MNYKLSDNVKSQIKSYLLLKYLDEYRLLVDDSPEYKCLSATLDTLFSEDLVKFSKDTVILTGKGIKNLDATSSFYDALLLEYKIYCAIDLQTGDFAYSQLPEFQNLSQFAETLKQPRWSDLRIQIAEFKNSINFETSDYIYSLIFALKKDEIAWYINDWQYKIFLLEDFSAFEKIIEEIPSWKDFGDDEQHAKLIFDDILKQGQELEAALRKQIK